MPSLHSADSGPAGLSWNTSGMRSGRDRATRSSCAISSQQKHLEVFLPTIAKWSRWKDRKKQIEWPLFPGYCFVRFDGIDRLPILKCDGVVTIVGNRGASLADSGRSEIDGIRQLSRVNSRSTRARSSRRA